MLAHEQHRRPWERQVGDVDVDGGAVKLCVSARDDEVIIVILLAVVGDVKIVRRVPLAHLARASDDRPRVFEGNHLLPTILCR